MDTDRLQDEVLPQIVEDLGKFPLATILVMDRDAQGTRISDAGKTVQHTDGSLVPGWNTNTRGAVVSIYNGDDIHEFHTGDVTADGISRAARELASNLSPRDPTIAYDLPGFERIAHYTSPREVDAREVPITQRVDTLRALDARARSFSGERSVSLDVVYHQMHTRELFVGPHFSGTQDLSAVRVQLNYGFEANGNSRSHTVRPGAPGFEATSIDDSLLEDAIRRGVQQCHAVAFPQGVRCAIGGPRYGAVVTHEADGHGREGDTQAQGIAAARLTAGERVASEYVTIVSDPTRAGFGHYCFDHEGMRGQRIVLVEDGIQTHESINDLMSATMSGQRPTGHGRRQSPFHAINSRQSYTGIEPLAPGERGYMSFEDQVRSMDLGLVIYGISGGMEDPHGGNVQIDAAFGEIVRDGKLTGEVCLAPSIRETVSGLYSSVAGVSSEVGLFSGSCGKWHGDWVAVDAGSPYVLFKDVRITGK